VSLRPRHGYAAGLPHGLHERQGQTTREVPRHQQGQRVRTASGPDPPGSSRRRFKGRKTPVPRVLLSIPLAGPAPSGGTGTPRLGRGCSHPPRHHPDQAAPSSTNLPRQARGEGLPPPLESQRLTAQGPAPTGMTTPCQAGVVASRRGKCAAVLVGVQAKPFGWPSASLDTVCGRRVLAAVEKRRRGWSGRHWCELGRVGLWVAGGDRGEVAGRGVGGVVGPAAPDDPQPGSAQDPDGVGVVQPASSGAGVDVFGPRGGLVGCRRRSRRRLGRRRRLQPRRNAT
jgi:hypothetical protein